MKCIRCGRDNKEPMAHVIDSSVDSSVGTGICMECPEEYYLNGWYIDCKNDEERKSFILKRMERYKE